MPIPLRIATRRHSPHNWTSVVIFKTVIEANCFYRGSQHSNFANISANISANIMLENLVILTSKDGPP